MEIRAVTPELQRKLEDAAVAAGIQLSLITQAKRYLRQLAPQAAEREGALLICQLVLKLQDAERMAAAVDDMVRQRGIDARSPLADARLDYGKPFSQSTVQEILSTRPEALRNPQDIIGNIVADICSRKGLSHEWEAIDDSIRDEIVAEWLTFFTPSPLARSQEKS